MKDTEAIDNTDSVTARGGDSAEPTNNKPAAQKSLQFEVRAAASSSPDSSGVSSSVGAESRATAALAPAPAHANNTDAKYDSALSPASPADRSSSTALLTSAPAHLTTPPSSSSSAAADDAIAPIRKDGFLMKQGDKGA